MDITVVITNYKRPDNVRCLINALSKQTVKSVMFVWDNSPNQDFNDPRVDWIVRSSRNAMCTPRWWMASHAETEFVLVHDDDLVPSDPEVLAWTLEGAAKTAPFAVGATGVILEPEKSYWESRHINLRHSRSRIDVHVDIIKGRYFCCQTKQLVRVGHLELDTEDDIAVSAKLGRCQERPHVVLAGLSGNFELLKEGKKSRKGRPNHRAMRDSARWQYFKARACKTCRKSR